MIGEQVICVNANFSPDQLAFWMKHGVIHPLKDKLYIIRTAQRHITGDTGIRLEEILNPQVPVKGIGIPIMMEPSFNLNRFRTLMGDKVKKETEVKEEAL